MPRILLRPPFQKKKTGLQQFPSSLEARYNTRIAFLCICPSICIPIELLTSSLPSYLLNIYLEPSLGVHHRLAKRKMKEKHGIRMRNAWRCCIDIWTLRGSIKSGSGNPAWLDNSVRCEPQDPSRWPVSTRTIPTLFWCTDTCPEGADFWMLHTCQVCLIFSFFSKTKSKITKHWNWLLFFLLLSFSQ